MAISLLLMADMRVTGSPRYQIKHFNARPRVQAMCTHTSAPSR